MPEKELALLKALIRKHVDLSRSILEECDELERRELERSKRKIDDKEVKSGG